MESPDLCECGCGKKKGRGSRKYADSRCAARAKRQRRIAAGLCTQSGCPNPPTPGRTICEKHSASSREKRQERIAAGLCAEGACPNPLVDGRTMCEKHLAKRRRRGTSPRPPRPQWKANGYPGDWRDIRRRILTRAGGRCECKGECGVEHAGRCAATDSPGVLGASFNIAHRNHDKTDNRDENLAAFCPACHLKHDMPHRNARLAEYKAKAEADGTWCLKRLPPPPKLTLLGAPRQGKGGRRRQPRCKLCHSAKPLPFGEDTCGVCKRRCPDCGELIEYGGRGRAHKRCRSCSEKPSKPRKCLHCGAQLPRGLVRYCSQQCYELCYRPAITSRHRPEEERVIPWNP